MRQATAVLAVAVLLAVSIPAARAQFGFFTMPVFDVTNYANALERYFQLEQQLAQLVKSYDQLVLEYRQMLWMARRLPDLARQRFVSAPWAYSSAADTYGSTGAWTDAANRAGPALDGYLAAVDRLGTYGAAFGQIPRDQLERVKTSYASVELADAANIHSIDVLGRQRVKAGDAERAIRSLESASLSESDDLNTEIAVLNKINAAGMMALRSGQETNQLLVSLLEQAVTESKARRDAQARAVNIDIGCRLHALDAGMRGVAGTTQAITSFTMP